ncbi:MAG: NAD(FAD)-utilizing dehydrogenase, partial [Firmicutes bacterium]|nr:NAD(FAD)-utilizing dehydrogenase [Bacillota bacterium]
MYRISEIKLGINDSKALLPKKIEKKLGKKLNGARISEWNIVKESLDARDKQNIHWVYTIDFDTKPSVNLSLPSGGSRDYEYPLPGIERLSERPVICGFGPAGMFCALALAENGYRPLVIERGKCADERTADVKQFWESGVLDPESNVQFGEGGAGTFSDGKLTTGIKDIRMKKVLREFVNAGAEAEILYKQKPHIGTDVLCLIVKNIRKKIESLGG